MSHFAALVVGENAEEQLAPYHEFECTGEDNCYVQDIDETEEARKAYESRTTTRYRDPKGNLHDPYTEDGDAKPMFYRDPTPEEVKKHGRMIGSGGGDGISWLSKDWGDGRGYRAKVQFMPESWSEVDVPTSTVETFAEFVKGWYGHEVLKPGETPDLADKHKYGYTVIDESGEVVKVIDRTNPNKKWDWYGIGGRWNGFFKLKKLAVGVLGKPGLQELNEDYRPPTMDRADICMKGDIDIEGMRDEAAEEAAKNYDLFASVTAGLPTLLSWQEIQKRNQTGATNENGEPIIDWKAAREEYHAQPAVKALSANKETLWFEDRFLVTREKYIQNARDSAFTTFAVVKDGQWYERGEMGWWGMVSGEKDRDDWNQQFSQLIDSLPDNTLLTVVDCHV